MSVADSSGHRITVFQLQHQESSAHLAIGLSKPRAVTSDCMQWHWPGTCLLKYAMLNDPSLPDSTMQVKSNFGKQ